MSEYSSFDEAPDESGPTGIGHINASAAYTGGRNLSPNQFHESESNYSPTDPFKQTRFAAGTPKWASWATNKLNQYEGARAFSRPGGLTRAIHYTLSGDPGVSRGVKATEVGEVLGGGSGLSEGSQAEDVGTGVVD